MRSPTTPGTNSKSICNTRATSSTSRDGQGSSRPKSICDPSNVKSSVDQSHKVSMSDKKSIEKDSIMSASLNLADSAQCKPESTSDD